MDAKKNQERKNLIEALQEGLQNARHKQMHELVKTKGIVEAVLPHARNAYAETLAIARAYANAEPAWSHQAGKMFGIADDLADLRNTLESQLDAIRQSEEHLASCSEDDEAPLQ